MRLKIPPEPEILKKQIVNQMKNIEHKIDSLTIWFGNKLPSYLWKEAGWSKPLKAMGYNWQGFLKILSLHKKDMIKWSWNSLTWRQLILRLQDTLKDPVFKKIISK